MASYTDKFRNLKVKLLPGFNNLTVKLSTLLDQNHGTGNNFRMVLEYLGFSNDEIDFLDDRYHRPTKEALRSWPVTTGKLVGALRRAEREDAIECVRQWLGNIAEQQCHVSSSSHYRACDAGASTVNSTLPKIEELLERTYNVTKSTPAVSPYYASREELLPIRRSGEYLCDTFIHFMKGCWLIPKDTTWITNSTVHVNNFARVSLLIMFIVNLVDCILSANHCPSHWLELVIFLLAVVQSHYVDKNLPPFKNLIHKIVECQNDIAELEVKRESRDTGPTQTAVGIPRGSNEQVRPNTKGRSTTEAGTSIDRQSMPNVSSVSGTIYERLDDAERSHARLLDEVQPKYSDMRLCVFSTMSVEVCILASLVFHASFFDTPENLLNRLRNEFTAIAYSFLLVDWFYNFVLIATYYHDNTPDTIIRKDRFRQRRISGNLLPRRVAANIRYRHDV
ncbi:hypothetical protein HOLleu_34832 [Holothuria leucospilota]|uniref:Death domain-containing protein n=1 Tax=Holothuria leucospilota TaxID=206669 RepID=A0A9Q1BHE2_HOLLE|nr:hypothetical protein HOLleu_34832 [Holothuria leucospilota]